MRSDRVMGKPRTCRDCQNMYRYADYAHPHRDSRYCATCLPDHRRKCAICRELFHPRIDTDRLCPTHVAHPPLFGKGTF